MVKEKRNLEVVSFRATLQLPNCPSSPLNASHTAMPTCPRGPGERQPGREAHPSLPAARGSAGSRAGKAADPFDHAKHCCDSQATMPHETHRATTTGQPWQASPHPRLLMQLRVRGCHRGGHSEPRRLRLCPCRLCRRLQLGGMRLCHRLRLEQLALAPLQLVNRLLQAGHRRGVLLLQLGSGLQPCGTGDGVRSSEGRHPWLSRLRPTCANGALGFPLLRPMAGRSQRPKPCHPTCRCLTAAAASSSRWCCCSRAVSPASWRCHASSMRRCSCKGAEGQPLFPCRLT